MRFFVQPLLFCICAAWFGCSGPKYAAHEPPLREAELIARLHGRTEAISSFYAEGSISFESEEMSNSGSFQMRISAKDSLRIDIRGPFGIRVATILLTATEGVYFDWLENRALYSSDYTKSAIIPFPIELSQLISILTSGVPPVSDNESLTAYTVTPESYFLRFFSSGAVKEFNFDRGNFIGRSFKLFDRDTTARLTVESFDSIEELGTSFPETIRINDYAQKSNITLVYDEIALNGGVVCSFTPPGSAKVTYR